MVGEILASQEEEEEEEVGVVDACTLVAVVFRGEAKLACKGYQYTYRDF